MTSYGESVVAGKAVEKVILLDEAGRAIGSAEKQSVHGINTPLHLAFSCYVFNAGGELLVTRRALDKITFPGVWTNSVCGHPAPGERYLDAVRRRTQQELGLSLSDLKVVLPAFRYRAVMANGMTENEICPVSTAVTADLPAADPAEVAATEWVAWGTFREDVLGLRREVSSWCLDQVRELAAMGDGPTDWPAARAANLPPAARPVASNGRKGRHVSP